MLSPSVCRLTLALLAFWRGTFSLIFPCTSSEIGNESAASLERTSKSPSSLFLALLENGHSPDIFSSFNLAQNIFPAEQPPASLLPLSNLRRRQMRSSSRGLWKKSHHFGCSSMMLSSPQRAVSNDQQEAGERIQYSLKTAWWGINIAEHQ